MFPSRAAHRCVVVTAEAFAISLYSLMKLAAISIMANSLSLASVIFWLAVECSLLLAVKARLGNWRWYIRGSGGPCISLFHHMIEYFCMLAAPLLILRLPACLTPCVYSGFCVWTVFLTNPMMIAISFAQDSPGVAFTAVCTSFSMATVMFLISRTLVFV